MNKNRIRKTVALNITNSEDVEILKKISSDGFNFNSYVRRLILEDIKREKMRSTSRTNKGGFKITLG